MTPDESSAALCELTDVLLSGVKSPQKKHTVRAAYGHRIEPFLEYAAAFTGWSEYEVRSAFYEGVTPKRFPALYQISVRATELLLLPSELGVTPTEALDWARFFLQPKPGAQYQIPKSPALLAARYFHREGVPLEFLATIYFEPSLRPQHELMTTMYREGLAPDYVDAAFPGWRIP